MRASTNTADSRETSLKVVTSDQPGGFPDRPSVECAASCSLVYALPCAVIVVDRQGVIRLANAEAAWVLERPSEQLQGASLAEILGPLEEILQLSAHSRDASLEFERPNGGRGRLGFTVSPIAMEGGYSDRTMYSVIFRNISRESSIASERDRLMRLASMGAAAPTIIHEVKNSLTSMIMGLELLERRYQDERARVGVRALLAEARKVTHTVQGFGAVGRDLRTVHPCDLGPMLSDAVRVLKVQAEAAGLTLEWQSIPIPPLTIEPSVLHAILSNLVTNAIHACKPGEQVKVTTRLENHRFVLEVEDNGCGMEPDVLARCTDLFFSTRPGGNGIGLALCREAIHAAGGDLRICSKAGLGTTMVVSIPGAVPLEGDVPISDDWANP